MKKIYHLQYLFTGGERHLKTENITVFASQLDEVLLNPHLIQGTIKIHTEEINISGPTDPFPLPKRL